MNERNGKNALHELTVYTETGAMSFLVKATAENFGERLSDAMEAGAVLLETAEGSKLLLNPVNTVAVEMREAKDIPPG